MDFNAQVQSISPEQLDALFSGTALAAEKEEKPEVNDPKSPKQVQVVETGIPTFDIDKLPEEGKEEEKKEEEKKEEPKKEEEKPDEKKEEKKEEVKEPSEEDKAQTSAILKNTVNYLVEKGIWQDFNERETAEYTDEIYAELSAKQAELKVEELFSELVDSTGQYGKAIISHIKNGGNPDEVIDLFKEQKQIQAVDISNADGQKSIIEKYYSEVVGWNKKQIDEFVSFKEGKEDGLENEAKAVQDKFDQLYSKELERMEREEKEREQAQKKAQDEYVKTLSKEIDSYDGFTDKDKKLVKDSLLKTKTLKNGAKVNDFYVKFYEIQNDPKRYIELVQFVMDKQGYDKKISVKESGKAVKDNWNFIKGSAAVSKKNAGELPETKDSKGSKIDFSTIFKK